MPVARKLLVAFLVLIGAFLVLVGLAVASLVTLGQPVLAAVVATAGVAGVAAGAATYWMLRKDGEDLGPDEIEVELESVRRVALHVETPRSTRAPLSVHSMPVADLPSAYVDAVMRGAQARLSALKQKAQYH